MLAVWPIRGERRRGTRADSEKVNRAGRRGGRLSDRSPQRSQREQETVTPEIVNLSWDEVERRVVQHRRAQQAERQLRRAADLLIERLAVLDVLRQAASTLMASGTRVTRSPASGSGNPVRRTR